MQQKHYLSNFIIKQFDVVKFKKMIKVFLSLVENFQIVLDEEEYYIKLTPSYEIRVGGASKPTHSKVESFVIKQYDTAEKKQQLILKYKLAFNCLNDLERKVFYAVFLEHKTTIDICEDLIVYPDKLNYVKKSAIVRFALKLGFDKFIDQF